VAKGYQHNDLSDSQHQPGLRKYCGHLFKKMIKKEMCSYNLGFKLVEVRILFANNRLVAVLKQMIDPLVMTAVIFSVFMLTHHGIN